MAGRATTSGIVHWGGEKNQSYVEVKRGSGSGGMSELIQSHASLSRRQSNAGIESRTPWKALTTHCSSSCVSITANRSCSLAVPFAQGIMHVSVRVITVVAPPSFKIPVDHAVEETSTLISPVNAVQIATLLFCENARRMKDRN